MYQKYEMVYTLVYVYILINEISLTAWVVILKYNCTCNCECTIYGSERKRERENLDLKKNHIVIFPLHIYQ